MTNGFALRDTATAAAGSEGDVAADKAAGCTNQSVLNVLVLAATKLISIDTNQLALTSNDAFMAGAEWVAPHTLIGSLACGGEFLKGAHMNGVKTSPREDNGCPGRLL